MRINNEKKPNKKSHIDMSHDLISNSVTVLAIDMALSKQYNFLIQSITSLLLTSGDHDNHSVGRSFGR
jgi:hypothetical protein